MERCQYWLKGICKCFHSISHFMATMAHGFDFSLTTNHWPRRSAALPTTSHYTAKRLFDAFAFPCAEFAVELTET